MEPVFTLRRYASAVYAVIVSVDPSVCPSVCLSQITVLQRWLNLGSHKQRHTIAQRLQFVDVKNLGEIAKGVTPNGGAKWR